MPPGELSAHTAAGKLNSVLATLGGRWFFPQAVDIYVSDGLVILPREIYPKEMKAHVHANTCA